jgi:hypothetical protein
MSPNKDRWYPYCANQKLCENECKGCFEKSFASHPKSKFLINEKKVNLRNIFKSNLNKYWFNCNESNHKFETSIANISQNSWCPYCTNQKLCEDIECKECF